MVAFGQMGDVALVGEQMTFAFRCEFLERVAPGASAGHRVDGVGPDDGIGLVIADHLPRPCCFSNPFAAAIFAGLENGARHQHGDGQRVFHGQAR